MLYEGEDKMNRSREERILSEDSRKRFVQTIGVNEDIFPSELRNLLECGKPTVLAVAYN